MPVNTRNKRKATDDTVASNQTASTTAAAAAAAAPPAKKAKAASKKKLAAKGRAKKMVEDQEEDGNDSGRNSSKTFFAKSNNEKKRKVNAVNAKEDIQEAVGEFCAMLEQEPERESSSNMAEMLRDHLPSNLDQIMIYDTPNQAQLKNTPLNSALAALQQVSTTITTYHALSSTTTIKRPEWMAWENDHDSLVDLNSHALDIAARQVNSKIIPGKKEEGKNERGSDVENLAWEILEGSRPEITGETWGGLAREQVKAFMGVLGGVVGV